ncbi:MAG: hypothetical protein J6X54_05580 [Treponema sp.]|nr:hypothetical protein [Treponema sp.]
MKKNKIIISAVTAALAISSLFAFSWPLENVDSSNIQSYFGQRRGNSISTSFIFSDPSEVKVIGEGKLLVYMTDSNDEASFFPTTLGTSVMIQHSEDLVSVYGNLDRSSLNANLDLKNSYTEQEAIGLTGNSGFQTKRSTLELQIFDSQKSTSINPKIFMPRTQNEIPYVISSIMLKNKAGQLFDINSEPSFKSGTYKIYQRRNSIATPYKSTTTINGVEIDQLSYDKIDEENNRIYISGKKKYLSTDIYPDENLFLLGEVILSQGKSTLGIQVEDYLGNIRKINYSILVTN